MLKLIRTDSKNRDFISLVSNLNKYLKTIDGDEHEFYMQYNNIDVLKHTVVAYFNEVPVGCGAFKMFDEYSVEIKRMFTLPEYRRKSVANKILTELENWSKEFNYTSCVLETGKRQIEAVNFYKKNNYFVIENFGQYIGIDNSVCFKKNINNKK